MTIAEVMERVKAARIGCEISESRLIADINRVEMNVMGYIVSGRVGDDEIQEQFGNYNDETDKGKELFVPAPYDTMYVDYCTAQIDKDYEDGERYANSMMAFNAALTAFKREYWKRNRQKTKYQYHGGN